MVNLADRAVGKVTRMRNRPGVMRACALSVTIGVAVVLAACDDTSVGRSTSWSSKSVSTSTSSSSARYGRRVVVVDANGHHFAVVAASIDTAAGGASKPLNDQVISARVLVSNLQRDRSVPALSASELSVGVRRSRLGAHTFPSASCSEVQGLAGFCETSTFGGRYVSGGGSAGGTTVTLAPSGTGTIQISFALPGGLGPRDVVLFLRHASHVVALQRAD
jgi:hypothetical protein